MASSSAGVPLAANHPLRRGFYIVPSGTAEEERELRESILASGAELRHSALSGAITVVANTHDVKANARWLDMHLHAHPIYRSSIVDALLEDPAAIDAEEHIWQKKTGKLPAHDKAPRPTLDINVTARKGDRRRLEQPKIEDLPDEHRQYLAKSKEQFLSETYVNPLVAIETPLEKKKLFIKRVRVPPPVPGAPAVKRKVGANGEPITIADDANEDGNGDNHNDEDEGEENGQHTQHTQSTGAHTQSSLGTAGSSQISIQAGLSSKEHLRNAFYGPPLALSDVERAADPAERNYMTSEDFAILMWYTRTIPYCGAEETLDGSPKFRHDYHQYRWNWARTHGVCLRPITSMQERWRRVVLFVFNGKQPIPEGTFRNFLAQSGFFYFEGDRILTYNVAAIKDANARCLTLLDADPTKDPYTQIEDKDKELYQEAIERISIKHVHVHEGQRWIAEAAAAAEPAEEAEED